ncbi:MAG TPA: hypothetical protein VGC41_12765 [Kofleriaceae bacterium]
MRPWLFVVVAACTFSPTAATTRDDARLADASDAMPDASRTCIDAWIDPASLAFTTPIALATLNTMGTERDPTLSADELQLWFASTRSGTSQVWTATRPDRSQPFGAATLDAQASGAPTDQTGRRYQTMNGQFYGISSLRIGTKGGFDLFIATSSGTGFGGPSNGQLSSVDDSSNQYDPWLSDDGKDLYYALGPSVGVEHVMRATRADVTLPFDAPVLVSELELGAVQGDPSLFANEQFILFSSVNPNNVTADHTDIWYAIRAGDGGWQAPRDLPAPINTASDEGDPWVSPDGCRLYFAAQVPGDDYDLFVANVML